MCHNLFLYFISNKIWSNNVPDDLYQQPSVKCISSLLVAGFKNCNDLYTVNSKPYLHAYILSQNPGGNIVKTMNFE